MEGVLLFHDDKHARQAAWIIQFRRCERGAARHILLVTLKGAKWRAVIPSCPTDFRE